MSTPVTLTSPEQLGLWVVRTDRGHARPRITADRYAVFDAPATVSIFPTGMRSVHPVPGEELRIEARGDGVGGFDE